MTLLICAGMITIYNVIKYQQKTDKNAKAGKKRIYGRTADVEKKLQKSRDVVKKPQKTK